MTLKVLLFSLLYLSLLAQEYGTVTFESTLHYENETTFGQNIIIPNVINKTLDNEQQKLATFYNILGYQYLSPNDTFAINLEGRANLQLSKSEYETPVYINKYNLDSINQAIVSVASLDLYTQYFTLSLGRNSINIDWLNGSLDSILLYHENSYLIARAFWFYNYYDFQVNYFAKNEDINDKKGIYGLFLQSGDSFEGFDLHLYYYLVQSIFALTGTQFAYFPTVELSLHTSYSLAKDLRIDKSFDETYTRFWGEYLINEYNSIELGMSLTGEHQLFAMTQFGSHPFSEFYLGNEIVRPKAENYYISYEYLGDTFYLQGIYGRTDYYGETYNKNRVIKEWMQSQEIDITTGFFINDYLSFDISYMYKDADEDDYESFDQQLFMANLKAYWP